MKYKYIVLVLILMVFVSGCSQNTTDSGSKVLTQIEQDKREVIHLVLETAILKQQIPDYNLINDKNNIVISSENIKEADLPTFQGVAFEYLTPDQIQRKANKEGDFLYLEFIGFTYEGDSIIVKLNNVWAISIYSSKMYLSGGGFEVKYTKKNSEWIEDIKSIWIS